MKGSVVTIMTNIGSPVRFVSKELDVLKPHCVQFAAAKREHVCIYPLAEQFLDSRVSRTVTQRSYRKNSDAISSILSCKQFAVGSNGSLEVVYTKGGSPVVLVPDDILEGSGLCRPTQAAASNLSNGGRRGGKVPITVTFLGVLLLSLIM